MVVCLFLSRGSLRLNVRHVENDVNVSVSYWRIIALDSYSFLFVVDSLLFPQEFYFFSGKQCDDWNRLIWPWSFDFLRFHDVILGTQRTSCISFFTEDVSLDLILTIHIS